MRGPETSGLGLFGMTGFTAERRTKEIGIRKVLGATLSDVLMVLSKDFLWLVLIANGIAWPVAYVVMDRWLQDFAYRVDVGVGTLALAGAFALLIAVATISLYTVRAARANPVDALRYE